MVYHYRGDDSVSGRWTGNTFADLSAQQIDENTYTSAKGIADLVAALTTTVSISSITISGNDLTFHMTDSSTQGPFTIPPSVFVDRGAWAPLTAYAVNDTFNINGTLYLVIFAHTSASTFSAGANDGAGHNYYAAMLSVPGASLPTGGATGQALQKSSGTDYAVTWGYKLPTGGTTNQALLKQSSTNQDANWTTLRATIISFTPSTGSTLTATNVSDAIEQAALAGGGGGSSLETLSDVSIPTSGPNIGDLLAYGNPWSNIPQSSLSLSFTQMTDLPSVVQLRNTVVTNFGSASGTVSVNPDLGNVFAITPTGAVTFNAANTRLGARISLIIHVAGTSSFTMTFGTNFISQGTLATGTVNAKNFVVEFVSDGIAFYETSRTAAM